MAREMRKPRDPFKYHLYVGCSIFDAAVSITIWEELKSRGIFSYFRNEPTEDPELSDIRIARGIRDSEKCLIYLSSAYLEDAWYKKETDAALEKAKRYGDSLLILVVSPVVSNTSIPEPLRNWPLTFVLPEARNPDLFWNELVETVCDFPPIKLAMMPELITGYSSACSYYTGYLRLVLPDFVQRMTKSILDPHPELRANCLTKMLIICPQSCYCPPSIEAPGKIDHTDMFVLKTVDRAGGKNRDLKTTLFKITDDQDKEVYYFAGELANPLMTLYDIYIDGLSGMTQDQLHQECTYFFLTLEGLFNHPDNADYRDQFKLLFWNDPKSGRSNSKSLHEFVLSAIRDELEQAKETAAKSILYERSRSENEEFARYNYIDVPVRGSNPGCVYDEGKIELYRMKRTPRGICLIISIVNYQKDLGLPSTRPGTEVDANILSEIFTKFHFAIELHADLTGTTLDSLLETIKTRSHDDYDAFVCGVLSHGRRKVINTSDGEERDIFQILDAFSPASCSSLKDKPKLFFIQISQMATIRESQDDSDVSLTPEVDDNMERKVLSLRGESDDCTPVFEVDEAPETHARPGEPVMKFEADAEHDQMTESVSMRLDAEPIESVPSPPVYSRSTSRQPRRRQQLVPRYPDCLLSFAVIPHSAPRLDMDAGSPFIRALSDNLRKTVEIDPAMKSVRDQVGQRLEELALTGKVSLPDHVSTMSKLLYF